MPKQQQGGDREATGWQQEGKVARIYSAETSRNFWCAKSGMRMAYIINR